MDKDLILQAQNLPAPAVTEIGEQKINNFNIKDSTVNFEVSLPENRNLNGEMLAVSQFSKQYYQLLVTMEDIFDEASAAVTISTKRALVKSCTPAAIFEQCSSLSPEGIEILKTIPAIITSEKSGRYFADVDPKQKAVYGYIKSVKKHGKLIKVYYQAIRLIPLHKLCENPIDYDANVECSISDFNASGWTVKEVNLFEAFQNTGLGHLPMPD